MKAILMTPLLKKKIILITFFIFVFIQKYQIDFFCLNFNLVSIFKKLMQFDYFC